MLHIVKHYRSLDEASANVVKGDDLLLVEDAVYAAVKGHKANAYLVATTNAPYSLIADVEARGLLLESTQKTVDFVGFVELTEKHSSSITWE
ncbi:sulfurtransferase complex subunit TusB [Vibrio sp. DW001]|uniref:sulfurtransferase complex subunit TusB n=1 Tax=Vibrio sp. DW001 TaxID=2912315 RepID=UPI0023AEFEB6|nr:sulfurtransferase complex subunit TusB [Vibrio sp. DW001]WED26458.1 sulfurtransferase complex subunit TusB [Vibrio sp. DW001]